MDFVGPAASRAQFEANMVNKMQDDVFLHDLASMLRPGLEFDHHDAWKTVHEQIVSLLPGDPWKGSAQ